MGRLNLLYFWGRVFHVNCFHAWASLLENDFFLENTIMLQDAKKPRTNFTFVWRESLFEAFWFNPLSRYPVVIWCHQCNPSIHIPYLICCVYQLHLKVHQHEERSKSGWLSHTNTALYTGRDTKIMYLLNGKFFVWHVRLRSIALLC